MFPPFFSPSKVAGLVENMVGNNLITKQTGKAGVKVNKVLYMVFEIWRTILCM